MGYRAYHRGLSGIVSRFTNTKKIIQVRHVENVSEMETGTATNDVESTEWALDVFAVWWVLELKHTCPDLKVGMGSD